MTGLCCHENPWPHSGSQKPHQRERCGEGTCQEKGLGWLTSIGGRYLREWGREQSECVINMYEIAKKQRMWLVHWVFLCPKASLRLRFETWEHCHLICGLRAKRSDFSWMVWGPRDGGAEGEYLLLFKLADLSRMCWYTTAMLTLGRLSQEDLNSRVAWRAWPV